MKESLLQKLEWFAPEYETKTQSTDWFWALGIIIVASASTSVILKNYFFAFFIVLSGILLVIFSIKKPEIVHYELNEKGLKIKDRLYPYDNMKSFWIHTGENSILFIKSDRFFMPIITIPIEEDDALKIKEIMLSQDIPEEEMKEHPSVKIMEKLGF